MVPNESASCPANRLCPGRQRTPAVGDGVSRKEIRFASGNGSGDGTASRRFRGNAGWRIYERAAIGIRKVCLELGGKSANIVLDDADLAVALPVSVGMCMANSGRVPEEGGRPA